MFVFSFIMGQAIDLQVWRWCIRVVRVHAPSTVVVVVVVSSIYFWVYARARCCNLKDRFTLPTSLDTGIGISTVVCSHDDFQHVFFRDEQASRILDPGGTRVCPPGWCAGRVSRKYLFIAFNSLFLIFSLSTKTASSGVRDSKLGQKCYSFYTW